MKLLLVLVLALQLVVPTLQNPPVTDESVLADAKKQHVAAGIKPEVHTRFEDYEVNLDSLCPVAPNEEALLCETSYNLAQQVNMVTVPIATTITLEKFDQTFTLTSCTLEKMPDLKMDLEIYCYVKGVKQALLENFKLIKSLKMYNDLILKLNLEMVKHHANPSMVTFYQSLKDELTTHKESFNLSDEGLKVSKTIKTKDLEDKEEVSKPAA